MQFKSFYSKYLFILPFLIISLIITFFILSTQKYMIDNISIDIINVNKNNLYIVIGIFGFISCFVTLLLNYLLNKVILVLLKINYSPERYTIMFPFISCIIVAGNMLAFSIKSNLGLYAVSIIFSVLFQFIILDNSNKIYKRIMIFLIQLLFNCGYIFFTGIQLTL